MSVPVPPRQVSVSCAAVEGVVAGLAVEEVIPGPAGGSLEIVRPKTAASRRQIMLTRTGVDALRRHRVEQAQERLQSGDTWHDHDLVFASTTGGPINPSNLSYRSFGPLLEKAGVPTVRFHDLRHTCATLLLGESVHPKVVSEMLGHTDVAVTLDLYSHVTPSLQQQAADALDGPPRRHFGCQLGCQRGVGVPPEVSQIGEIGPLTRGNDLPRPRGAGRQPRWARDRGYWPGTRNR